MIRGLKKKLKILNKKAFGGICERTQSSVDRLTAMQVQILEGNGTQINLDDYDGLKQRVSWLKKVEKSYLN